MKIGKKIKQLRGTAGLSIARLAAKAGLSPDYILKIEHERTTNVGIEKLDKIAKALGLTLVLDFQDKNKAA